MADKALFQCPVCGSGNVIAKKTGFLSRDFKCENCGTQFEKRENRFALAKEPTLSEHTDRYTELADRFTSNEDTGAQQSLSPDDWNAVAGGGKTASETQKEAEEQELQRQRDQIAKEELIIEALESGDFSGLPPIQEPPVMLKKGEEALLVMPDAVDLYEERVRHEYQGGTAGVSLRVAKGMSVRAGGFKGERVPVSEQKHIDTGSLTVTNKRLIFIGPSKSTSFATNKILNVEGYDDGIRVNREGKQKPEYYLAEMHSPTFQYRSPWMMVKAVIQGTLQAK